MDNLNQYLSFINRELRFISERNLSEISEKIKKLHWYDIIMNTKKSKSVSFDYQKLTQVYFDESNTGEKLLIELQNDFSKVKTMGEALATVTNSLPFMVTVSARISILNQNYNNLKEEYQDKRNESYVYFSLYLSILSILLGVI